MKTAYKVLSLLTAIIITLSVFAACERKDGKNEGTTGKDSETVTEIVTDENGETSIVIKPKTPEGEKDSEKAGNDTENGETDENGETLTPEKKSDPEAKDTKKDGKSTNSAETNPAPETKKSSDSGKSEEKNPSVKKETTGADTTKMEPIPIPMEIPEKKDPKDAKLADGISIDDVAITRLDDVVSIELKASNSKNYEQIIDFSYLVMKVNDKVEVLNTFKTMPISASAKDTLFSMPIEDDTVDLSIGTSVSVYYGYDLIGTVTVGLF